ncbi:hypothetical protein I79_001936 [Cricetulus griseus]|uniref:Uncharacterized protein n=1 Tax=Cricetulus griseus TaxID=10029 RepID=G3GW25_CRIGR|nr:hypothetical protein I79_001936 [Cricetulus griseus]
MERLLFLATLIWGTLAVLSEPRVSGGQPHPPVIYVTSRESEFWPSNFHGMHFNQQGRQRYFLLFIVLYESHHASLWISVCACKHGILYC